MSVWGSGFRVLYRRPTQGPTTVQHVVFVNSLSVLPFSRQDEKKLPSCIKGERQDGGRPTNDPGFCSEWGFTAGVVVFVGIWTHLNIPNSRC